MSTETVSVAELKAHLSAYLTKARAGRAIQVTSHRRPVACITGVPEQAPAGLARLIARGQVTPGDGQPLRLKPPIRLSADGPLVSDLVLEDRGPRG